MSMPALSRACSFALLVALSLPSGAQVVNSFTVVNADTGADITTARTAGSVSLASTPRINVRANASDAVKVVFTGDAGSRTEGSAPFALKGNSGATYHPWSPTPRSYAITATAYNAAGVAGQPLTLKLLVASDVVVARPTVNSFTVVDADTGKDIATFNGAGSVSIATTPRINVRANASDTSKVVFSGSLGTRTEGAAPFALVGNSGATYYPWSPAVGTYSIDATPYGGTGGNTTGALARLTLTVTGGTAPPPGPNPLSHVYPATAGPDRNPHKGWNSGWGIAQPESSVGFQYLAWRDFEPSNGTFDFDKVEQILARAGSKGQHFVLRLHCDWGSADETRCPAWIYNEVGVRRLRGDNGKALTDFNDPRYLDEAVQAIQALAQRYDGDPRVHAFQLGVLGCWGEWHACGFTQNGVKYEITDASKNRILQAYKTNFRRAPIQGRYPWREPLTSAGFIGFHNDYFIPNNGHSNDFDAALAAGGQWQNGPVGGEVPPRSSSQADSEKAALFTTATGRTMIETARYSTMLPHAYRVDATSAYYPAYMQLHRLMGYNFRIEQAVFAETLGAGQNLTVRLDGHNVGVARLYYPWSAQFALLDAQGRPAAQADAAADLTVVEPAGAFSLAASLTPTRFVAGTKYRLAVRLVQPGATAAKAKPWGLDARNAYILFANDLPTLDGLWGADNALVGGWSVLGEITLR